MNRIVIILSSILLLIGINSCTKQNKVWLVSIGESKESVKQTLDNEKIKYTDQDTAINIEKSIKYLDIDWNKASISFENNVTTAVLFQKLEGAALSKEQKKKVVYQFDDIYGDHKYDKSTEYGLSGWSWDKDGTVVSFMSILKGQYAMLLVCKIKDKKSEQ